MLDPLALIAQYESGNQNIPQGIVGPNGGFNPSTGTVTGPSTAGGYYQITNSTWAGIPSSITQGYTSALSAPYGVQTNAAAYLYNTQGFAPWAPFNSNLSSAIAQQGGTNAFPSPGSYTPPSDPLGIDNGAMPFSSLPDTPVYIASPDGFSSGLTGNSFSQYTPTLTDPAAIAPDGFNVGGGLTGQSSSGSGLVDTSGLALPSDFTANSDLPFSAQQGTFTDGTTMPSSGINSSLTNPLTGLANVNGGVWWNNAVTIAGDYLARFGLVLLALILIGTGVFALSHGDLQKAARRLPVGA